MAEIVSKIQRIIPDKVYLSAKYYKHFHRLPNLRKPETFTEKIQWLKLYDRREEYITYVDKYLVKEYIAEKLGWEYIIPTLAVWSSIEEIDIENLPEQFVIKSTHDSGSIIVCKDKKKFNLEKAKSSLQRGLISTGYWYGREWPYKQVVPKLIVEQYMEDTKTHELRDYKFFCFNGVVKMFKVDFDRFTNHRANYYDEKGHILPFGEKYLPPDFDRDIEIPASIPQMIELAQVLSKGIPFVRVDFYDVNGRIYFGELTFYPASGFGPFTSNDADLEVGSWLQLPEIKRW